MLRSVISLPILLFGMQVIFFDIYTRMVLSKFLCLICLVLFIAQLLNEMGRLGP